MRLFNDIGVVTSTTGTGTVTLGAVIDSTYMTFAEAGVPDATQVSYAIKSGNDVEFGRGTYTASGTTLSRDTVVLSKIGGTGGTSKITLAGTSEVRVVLLAEDVPGGSNTQVQFNDSGVLAGDANLTWVKGTTTLTAGNTVSNSSGVFLPDGGHFGVKGASDTAHGVRHSSVIDGLHLAGFAGITFNRGSPSTNEMGRFDSSSRLLIGSQVALGAQQTLHDGGQVTPWFEIIGDGADSSSFGVYRFSNTSTSASFTFTKSRGLPGDSPDVQTVQASDALGDISFVGVDPFGTPRLAVFLEARADVAPGGTAPNGYVPGRFLIRIAPQSSGNPEEVLRVDSQKKFVFGGGNSTSAGVSAMSFLGNTTQLQNMGIDAGSGGMTLAMFNATAGTCAHLDFYRSKNATVGSADNVANAGDAIGKIVFIGAQQTGTFSNQNAAGQILCELDGTATGGVGADMPGRVSIWTTPDGSGTLAEALRLDSSQRTVLSQNYSGASSMALGGGSVSSKVQIIGNNTATAGLSISMFNGSGGAGSAGQGGIGPHIDFYRSGNGTTGTAGVPPSTAGSGFGILNFYGAQQDATLTTQTLAAQIAVETDGTATSGTTVDMPARLRISLMPDGLGGTPASTDPVEVLRINNLGHMTGTDLGLYEEVQYTTLNNDFTGVTTGATAQPFFSTSGDVFTADGTTTYEFDCQMVLSKSAGTTSHTIAMGFGGTATFTSLDYTLYATPNMSTLVNTSAATPITSFIKAATSTVVTTAITSATSHTIFRASGIIIVNAAGTIIPQYTLSASPGGAYLTARGSFFRLWRLGAVVRGQWA